jgi:hypothetical protein
MGNVRLTCWEVPPWRWFVITCFTPNGDFRARFVGQKEDIEGFYRLLRNVTEKE